MKAKALLPCGLLALWCVSINHAEGHSLPHSAGEQQGLSEVEDRCYHLESARGGTLQPENIKPGLGAVGKLVGELAVSTCLVGRHAIEQVTVRIPELQSHCGIL